MPGTILNTEDVTWDKTEPTLALMEFTFWEVGAGTQHKYGTRGGASARRPVQQSKESVRVGWSEMASSITWHLN